jgi:predicted DNA-binding transcriptional regulator AlpA
MQPETQTTNPSLLTADQIKEDSGTSNAHFYRAIRPHLDRVEIGGAVRYTRESYERFKAERLVPARGSAA